MERKGLIILAVLVTLAVITPSPDGMDGAPGTVASPTAAQPAVVRGAIVGAGAEGRCTRSTAGKFLLALPGNTSI